MNSFACPITRDCTVSYYLCGGYSIFPYTLPPPGEPTRSVLHLSSCHGETSSVAMTAQQSRLWSQSANQSLCEVDSDADILQNAQSGGKLD